MISKALLISIMRHSGAVTELGMTAAEHNGRQEYRSTIISTRAPQLTQKVNGRGGEEDRVRQKEGKKRRNENGPEHGLKVQM